MATDTIPRVRVAAVGDIHFGIDSAGSLRPYLDRLAGEVDALLLAGDLTRRGRPEEAQVLAAELAGAPVPVVGVLGNHDHESDAVDDVVELLASAGATILEGTATTFDVGDVAVGVAGVKGFGGGFLGASGSDFGEPEMKAFIRHTATVSGRLEAALCSIASADVRIALLHYAPVEATLVGERLEIYPFLGSYLLAEAVDRAGADVALHGHAHGGAATGCTPGGVPVHNVAQPVVGGPFAVLGLEQNRHLAREAAPRV